MKYTDKDTVDYLIKVLTDSKPTFERVLTDGGLNKHDVSMSLLGMTAAIETIKKVTAAQGEV